MQSVNSKVKILLILVIPRFVSNCKKYSFWMNISKIILKNYICKQIGNEFFNFFILNFNNAKCPKN